MDYYIKTGEREEVYTQMAQVLFAGNPWANIWIDCCGTCEPQQSIGIKTDSNAVALSITDEVAIEIFEKHGWTHNASGKRWLCPCCSLLRGEDAISIR